MNLLNSILDDPRLYRLWQLPFAKRKAEALQPPRRSRGRPESVGCGVRARKQRGRVSRSGICGHRDQRAIRRVRQETLAGNVPRGRCEGPGHRRDTESVLKVSGLTSRLMGTDPLRVGCLAEADAFLRNARPDAIEQVAEDPGHLHRHYWMLERFHVTALTSGG